MAKPHYYPQRDGWFIWTKNAKGTRVRKFLAKTEKAAEAVWLASIRAGESRQLADPLFSDVADKWLSRQWQRYDRKEISNTWLERVARTIERFTTDNKTLTCSQLTPAFARAWMPKGSSASYEYTELGTLKQILKWAVSEGKLIASSPLADLQLRKGKRRELLISLEQHRVMVRPKFVWSADASGRRCQWKPKAESTLRAMLWFAWWTGARPSELRKLKWEQLTDDCSRAVLREHKTARTGRARTIYFNPLAASILQRHRKASGLVFINSRGRPWTKDALVRRMAVIQERTGIEQTAYAYRHSFITRMLIAGVSAADVAELTGTSLKMVAEVYGHLDKAVPHLLALVSRLR